MGKNRYLMDKKNGFFFFKVGIKNPVMLPIVAITIPIIT